MVNVSWRHSNSYKSLTVPLECVNIFQPPSPLHYPAIILICIFEVEYPKTFLRPPPPLGTFNNFVALPKFSNIFCNLLFQYAPAPLSHNCWQLPSLCVLVCRFELNIQSLYASCESTGNNSIAYQWLLRRMIGCGLPWLYTI